MAAISVPIIGVDKSKRRVDAAVVVAFIMKHRPDHAFIERAQAMPDQGSSSGFNYGRAVGYLEACVVGCQIPLHIIEARAWKKRFGLSRDKEESRQAALRLFPEAAAALARAKDHNRAEAALIAAHGLETLLGR